MSHKPTPGPATAQLGREKLPCAHARLCLHNTICSSEAFARCAGQAAAGRAAVDQARARAESVASRRAQCACRLHAQHRRAPVLSTDILQLQAVPPCCLPTTSAIIWHRCALAKHASHHTAQLRAASCEHSCERRVICMLSPLRKLVGGAELLRSVTPDFKYWRRSQQPAPQTSFAPQAGSGMADPGAGDHAAKKVRHTRDM